nr:MAG TPA: hypothetical protein [Bacteriophage sp.]
MLRMSGIILQNSKLRMSPEKSSLLGKNVRIK